jgi:uncharacterized protein (DUF433 family)
MNTVIQPEAPPLRVDESGAIRVGNTRVLMVLVVRAFQDGVPPEEIVQRYDTLALADVYGVIAYYLRHRAEVEQHLAEYERKGDELQRQIEAEYGSQEGLRQRLLDRLSSRSK